MKEEYLGMRKFLMSLKWKMTVGVRNDVKYRQLKEKCHKNTQSCSGVMILLVKFMKYKVKTTTTFTLSCEKNPDTDKGIVQ